MKPNAAPVAEEFSLPPQLIAHYCDLAWAAMLTEANLSPKPGLVDRYNCGAHKDMNLGDFYRSATVIRAWLPYFMEFGAFSAALGENAVLPGLRPLGLACEAAMLQATCGVNTHKGSIFSLGLLCAAIGRLYRRRQPIDAAALCRTAALFCHGLTENELQRNNPQKTAGQRLYCRLGLAGARGEAEAGYPLVLHLALPHYQARLAQDITPQFALLDTLLLLMTHNGDTNIAARGGAAGLLWLQKQAGILLKKGGINTAADLISVYNFDKHCINNNLSPGGSADLLIITWFLAQIAPTDNVSFS